MFSLYIFNILSLLSTLEIKYLKIVTCYLILQIYVMINYIKYKDAGIICDMCMHTQ